MFFTFASSVRTYTKDSFRRINSESSLFVLKFLRMKMHRNVTSAFWARCVSHSDLDFCRAYFAQRAEKQNLEQGISSGGAITQGKAKARAWGIISPVLQTRKRSLAGSLCG